MFHLQEIAMFHKVADKQTWFIIPEISLSGMVEQNQNITSPHEVEIFDKETDWQTRKDELGITEEGDEDVN